jgi:hypothetical protein
MSHPRRLIALTGCALAAGLIGWTLHSRTTEPIDSYTRCAADGNPITETDPPTCRDGRGLFVGPRGSPAASAGLISAIRFDLLVQGDSGGNYPKRQEIISTQSDWQRYWREVHSGLSSLPPILRIDFSQNDVIALSLGRQMTAGYGLMIIGITDRASGTTVNVTETIPTITCVVPQVVTNRYYIAKTPKLTPPVSFQISTNRHHCTQ